nr:response regulator transcription factor [uncultured Flavobacterium sp.]
MKCLIADDHWIVRKGMISIIENHFSELVFDQASSIAEIFSFLKKNQYSLLFLDFCYLDGTLKDVISEIKSISNPARIVVMSSSITYFDYLVIKPHVNVILSKHNTQASIISNLHKMFSSEESFMTSYHQPFFDKVDLLSDRELEIVKLIISGYGNKEMVNKLGLKENTISTMRKRAFDKLQIDNNVELINFFMQSVL